MPKWYTWDSRTDGSRFRTFYYPGWLHFGDMSQWFTAFWVIDLTKPVQLPLFDVE